MKFRQSAALAAISLVLLLVSCEKKDPVTQGNHDVPDSWQQEVRHRADMIADIQWTPLFKAPKSFYKRKDVWFDAGTTYTGLPYSAVELYNGFIGRDVSFYTFLSALHNPKSSIYTLDYRQPPYNRDKGSIMYGVVCTSASAFALGLPLYHPTVRIRGGVVPYYDDMGNAPRDVRIGDVLCFFDPAQGEGHVMVAYDITRTKGGSLSKAIFFEGVGPLAKRSVFTEEKLRSWFESHDAHIYRLKEEYRSLRPSPFMEKDLSSLPPFPEALCLDDGDRRSYAEGTTVRIDVFSTSYSILELYKGEALYASYPVSEVVELTDLPVGLYSACLSGASGKSESTLFQIGSTDFTVRRSGTTLTVSGCAEECTPVYSSTNESSGIHRVFFNTAPGEWSVEGVPETATHCRVYFAGRYGTYKGKSIEIQ